MFPYKNILEKFDINLTFVSYSLNIFCVILKQLIKKY